MDEAVARRLLEDLRALCGALNTLGETSMAIDNEAERQNFRKALGTIMADVDGNLIRPLERNFPHLEGIAIDKS
ncbi:MAG: hypothetical protein ABL871_09750 [Terricaulis sp.]